MHVFWKNFLMLQNCNNSHGYGGFSVCKKIPIMKKGRPYVNEENAPEQEKSAGNGCIFFGWKRGKNDQFTISV